MFYYHCYLEPTSENTNSNQQNNDDDNGDDGDDNVVCGNVRVWLHHMVLSGKAAESPTPPGLKACRCNTVSPGSPRGTREPKRGTERHIKQRTGYRTTRGGTGPTGPGENPRWGRKRKRDGHGQEESERPQTPRKGHKGKRKNERQTGKPNGPQAVDRSTLVGALRYQSRGSDSGEY